MASLKERLLSIEQDFVSALVHGEDAISAFNDRWDTLADDLSSAVDSAALDPETSLLAHTTAIRLATLADTSVELFNSYNTITLQLIEDVDSMMSNLSLDDYDNLCPASGPSTRPSRSQSTAPSPVDLGIAKSFGRTCRAASPRQVAPSSEQRKRRRSTERPAVRICSDTDTSLTSIPSRAPRINGKSRQIPTTSFSCDDKSSPSPIRTSRKRRLSDAGVSIASPPCKRFYRGPRLHAVSDTFIAHKASSPMVHSGARQEPVLDSSTPLDLTILQSPTAELIVPCQLDLPSDALQCHLGTTDALSSDFNNLLESLFDPHVLPTPPTPSLSSYSLAPLPHHRDVGAFCAASDSVSTAPSSPQSISSSESSLHPATPPPTYELGADITSALESLPNTVNQLPSWLPIPTSEEYTILSIAPATYPYPAYPTLGEHVTAWDTDKCWTSWFDSMESCISLPIPPPPYLSDLGLDLSPTAEPNGPRSKGSERLGLDNGFFNVALTEGCLA